MTRGRWWCDTVSPGARFTRNPAWWLFYLCIAIFASWPLIGSLSTAIPVGVETEATVPLLNVWTLWWNANRAAAGFTHYWDAPIFYPTRGTFAFSEAQPTMIVVAPIVWLSGSCVLGYNIYQLLILSLNGFATRRLLLRVGHSSWLATCGGVMCEMLPFVWWQLGVVQLTTIFGVVWTIHAMLDAFQPERDSLTLALSRRLMPIVGWIDRTVFRRKEATSNPPDDGSAGTLRSQGTQAVVRGIRLGLSFCVTYWLCNYWGLFLVMLAVPSSLMLWNMRLLRLQFWCEVIVAAVMVLMLVGPIAYVQRSLSSQHKWNREQSLILNLSARPWDYLDTPKTADSRQPSPPPGAPQEVKTVEWSNLPKTVVGRPWLEFPEDLRENIWPLGGGGLKLLLAPGGLIAALFIGQRRRWALFAALLGVIAFGISLGPTVCMASWLPIAGGACPYELLQKYVPGFALIRSPFRFSLFVQLAATWLALEALDLLNPRRWWNSASRMNLSANRESNGGRFVVYASFLPLICFSLIAVFEIWPPRQRLYSDATSRPQPAWTYWLKSNSEPTDAIACLPFPYGYNVHDYEDTSVWMYWETFHARPMVNGYSGFFPESFTKLKDGLCDYYQHENGAAPKLALYYWDSPGLKALNKSGVRFVVVKRSFATRDDVWEHTATKFRWAWVTGDEFNQVDVYEVQPE